MGLCGSKDGAEDRVSKAIQELVEKDSKAEEKKVKLLLLGEPAEPRTRAPGPPLHQQRALSNVAARMVTHD